MTGLLTAIFTAVGAVAGLALWLAKRYFTRDDEIAKLKQERQKVRNEISKAKANKHIDRYHHWLDKLHELDNRIAVLTKSKGKGWFSGR